MSERKMVLVDKWSKRREKAKVMMGNFLEVVGGLALGVSVIFVNDFHIHIEGTVHLVKMENEDTLFKQVRDCTMAPHLF